MVIQNQSTENGDVLHFSTDIPILGIILLNSFADGTYIATPGSDFDKKFRYSLDGGNSYTDWLDLTIPNIQAIPTNTNLPFICDYMYTHTGVDAHNDTGGVYFNWVELMGEGIGMGDFPIYDKTDFGKYFPIFDMEVIQWAYNVMEKLYSTGIIPKYVRRDCPSGPEDYSVFYLSITHFFAILVKMARLFRKLNESGDTGAAKLFNKFIEDKGLVLRGDEINQAQLWNYLFSSYKEEYRKRGTDAIIEKASSQATLDGEFLRLINYQDFEEFMFFNLVRQDLGWCLDYSSPMWTGCEQIVNAIKEYEKLPGLNAEDLSKYPTVGTVTLVSGDDGRKWLQFGNRSYDSEGMTVAQETCGIEVQEVGSLYKDKYITVSPDISYEILFEVKVDFQKNSRTENPLFTNFSFGVGGYDKNGNKLSFYSGRTYEETNSFFSKSTYTTGIYPNGQGMIMRGVLLAADTLAYESRSLSFTNGVPLIMNPDTRFITPIIKQRMTTGVCPISITGFRVIPKDLSIERGYLGSINPVVAYFYNRSGNSDEYIRRFTERYLIPIKWGFLLSTYLQEVAIINYTLTVNVTVNGQASSGDGMVTIDPPIPFNTPNQLRQNTPVSISIDPIEDYIVEPVTTDNDSITTDIEAFSFALNKNTTIDITLQQAFIILYVYGHGTFTLNCDLAGEDESILVKVDGNPTQEVTEKNGNFDIFSDSGAKEHTVVIMSHNITAFNYTSNYNPSSTSGYFRIRRIVFGADDILETIYLRNNDLGNVERGGIVVSGLSNLKQISIIDDASFESINLSSNVNLQTIDFQNDYNLKTITLSPSQNFSSINLSVEDSNLVVNKLGIAYSTGIAAEAGYLNLSQVSAGSVACSYRGLDRLGLPANIQTLIADHNLFTVCYWQPGLIYMDYSDNLIETVDIEGTTTDYDDTKISLNLHHNTQLESVSLTNLSCTTGGDRWSYNLDISDCGGSTGIDFILHNTVTLFNSTNYDNTYFKNIDFNGHWIQQDFSLVESVNTIESIKIVGCGGISVAVSDAVHPKLTVIDCEDSSLGNFNPGSSSQDNVLETYILRDCGATEINLLPYRKSLVTCDLSENPLTSLGISWTYPSTPTEEIMMSSLKSLTIDGQAQLYLQSSGTRTFNLLTCPALEELIFKNWSAYRRGRFQFKNGPKLKKLVLDDIWLSAVDVLTFPQLTEIDLSNNESSLVSVQILDVAKLTTLTLPNLTNSGTHMIQDLIIDNTSLQEIPAGWGYHPLRFLYISNCPYCDVDNLLRNYVYKEDLNFYDTLQTFSVLNCPKTKINFDAYSGNFNGRVFANLSSLRINNTGGQGTFYIPRSNGWKQASETGNYGTYAVDISNNKYTDLYINAKNNERGGVSINVNASDNSMRTVIASTTNTPRFCSLNLSNNASFTSMTLSTGHQSSLVSLDMTNCTSYNQDFSNQDFPKLKVVHISGTKVPQLHLDNIPSLEDFEYLNASNLTSISLMSRLTEIKCESIVTSHITNANVFNSLFEDMVSTSYQTLVTLKVEDSDFPTSYRGWKTQSASDGITDRVLALVNQLDSRNYAKLTTVSFKGCVFRIPNLSGTRVNNRSYFVVNLQTIQNIKSLDLSSTTFVKPSSLYSYSAYVVYSPYNTLLASENYLDSAFGGYASGMTGITHNVVKTINITGSNCDLSKAGAGTSEQTWAITFVLYIPTAKAGSKVIVTDAATWEDFPFSTGLEDKNYTLVNN